MHPDTRKSRSSGGRAADIPSPIPLSVSRAEGIEGYRICRSRVQFSPALPIFVFDAHGRGRASPGPVAQQRRRERGVAARLPMPDEGRSVRGDDVETRVRFPPARAASSTSATWARPLATPLPALYPSASGRRSRVIRFSGFESRLVHVADCFTVSSGSPHLGYPPPNPGAARRPGAECITHPLEHKRRSGGVGS